MNINYNTVELLDFDCPFCDKVHKVERRRRNAQAIIKKEAVVFDEEYFFCPDRTDDENEFVPAGLSDQNLLNARNAYRKMKGLLTSDEIVEIRKNYGMTQSEFSALLGWGDVTITRYETKLIQDETYDKLIRMVGENPKFALESLDQHRDSFLSARYRQLRNNIQEELARVGEGFFTKQEILSQYTAYEEPCDSNGYQLLNIEKLGAMMSYFANNVKRLYKVRLMKMLWFSDAVAFSRNGKAISGLVYRHATYGALPIASQKIIYLPSVAVTEEELELEQVKYRISPVDSDFSSLSAEELTILAEVTDKFKYMQTEDVVNCMHNEDAYTKTEMHEIIPFSLCSKLRAFQ